MTSNVRMILDEVNARIKLAEAKTAEDPSNFDAFPGAENDKAVPSDMKAPDPEVKDEGPASRTEATGAKPGSDAPVTQDHLYEADEPVLTPDKKPADSADANAKTAAAVNPDVEKVASDILGMIRGSLAKQAAEKVEKVEKKAEEKVEAKAEKDAGCGGCKKAKKPAKKTAEEILNVLKEAVAKQAACGAPAPAKKPAEKKAPVKKEASDAISLEDKILDKIAGIRMAKQAGANDAMALIKAAEEYNRGAADARALIQKIAQALEETANSADDAKACEGGACDAGSAEAAGAADAEAAIADAAAADASASAATADDQVTPEEVAQAVSELVDEGQISQEDAATLVSQIGGDTPAAGATGDVTDEQIAEGIAQAIESGEITEDEAQQLVQELVSAGADPSVQDSVAAAPAAEAAAADAATAEEAAGAADAEAAIADAQKQAEAMQKKAEDAQIARYQKGFIQKCAEYGADPQKVAQYIQARMSVKR